jgi:hypothetical protein
VTIPITLIDKVIHIPEVFAALSKFLMIDVGVIYPDDFNEKKEKC